MRTADKEKDGAGAGVQAGAKNSSTNQNWIPKIFQKRACANFIEDTSSNGALCQCGGTRQSHASVAMEDHFGAAIVSKWDSAQHTTELPTDAFGDVEFAGKSKRLSHFLRLSCDTDPQTVYRLMTSHWAIPVPNLVVSVCGGGGKLKMKSWVREVLRQGLVKAAQGTGAWILTGGLCEGIGRYVGEAVRDHATASTQSNTKVIAVGIASWGIVHNREQLVNPQGSFPARYYVQNTSCDTFCLDNNYQAFLLVDDGSVGRSGGETGFRARLENYISHQRTGIWGSGNIEIPVLCMLVAGEEAMLERVDRSLQDSTPWLVLAGTGGMADFLCEVLQEFSSIEQDELAEFLQELLKKHFPHSTEKLSLLTERVIRIMQSRELLNVYDAEQDGSEDFDTVILKALVRACKRQSSDSSEYIEELKLAVAWNRVDIAKSELFNGDVVWKYADLEDSMTDALVNNKPEFVRLFTENGLNILDYLTYGRLEKLYCALPVNCLAHQLLDRRLHERRSSSLHSLDTPAASSPSSAEPTADHARELTLFEVSRVLRDLLGDACEPFYSSCLGLSRNSGNRKSLKRMNKLLLGDCSYRQERCATPWIDLFIWAVLQDRSKMATFFWEMAGDSVTSALAASKILRELSRLQYDTESKLSMKDLANRFENLAHDVFSECYKNDEMRCFLLLIRRSPFWGKATCLQLATVADARLFFSHDGVQSLLTRIWWGDMDSSTEVWKVIATFFCPPLVYTSLIKYREVEEEVKNEEPQAKELDSCDGDTIFSMKDITKNPEEKEELESLKEKPRDCPAHSPGKPRPYVVARWRQFWFAPVTSFLGNVLMYFLFLLLFASVLLVDFKQPPPDGPSPKELFLYFWVFTLVCEEIRQTFFIGNLSVLKRMKVYIQDMWNKCDLTAIVLFIIGLCCRMFLPTFEFGRAVLCLDFMVFALRLLHIFAVNKQLGPKIIIVGKMMKDIFFFLFFLGVWLMAYGVANQALLYPYEPRPEWIMRRVFYRPYLHIFGQIPLEDIDAAKMSGEGNCSYDAEEIHMGLEPCTNTYANWLVIILLVVYLLVTNILLLNLLIAMFSYTFSKVQGNSDIYWKFQRYNLIVEYHNRPALAPPFILLSHINLLIKRNIRKVPSVKIQHFMLDLSKQKDNRLLTWEAIQKENFLAQQNKCKRESDSERLKRTSNKVDNVLKHMAEIRDHDRRLKVLESEMEYCSSALSWMVEALSQSNVIKATRPPPTHKDPTTPL
ncbi:TRPM4 protein, partial [Atractosteus spatula]|nr:TRPM4 protein [Atractosteus spatula]